MADKLVIGVELLDYCTNMLKVVEILGKAREKVSEIELSFSGEEVYYGSALGELQIFYKQLGVHIDKLILLYRQGSSYIYNTYQSMYQSDEAMAVWLLNQSSKEGGIS